MQLSRVVYTVNHPMSYVFFVLLMSQSLFVFQINYANCVCVCELNVCVGEGEIKYEIAKRSLVSTVIVRLLSPSASLDS